MEKLKIGKIVGTHGLKGELKIHSISDFEDQRFVVGKRLVLQGLESIELKIATVRFHKGNYLVSFENMQNINLVEKYKGYFVYGYRDDVELVEGEFFYDDLIGCDVYDSDKRIGKVVSLFDNGAHEILSVQTDNKKISIPYVDAFIEKEDIKNKIIYVHLIKGFLDED